MVVSTLSSDSAVFSFIQYHLKQTIGASAVTVLEIEEISNPQLTIQFEKKSKVRIFNEIGIFEYIYDWIFFFVEFADGR